MFQFRKHFLCLCSGSARSGPEALPSTGVEAQFADFPSEAPTNSMAWILQTASWAERVFVHTFPERSAAIWGVSPPTQNKNNAQKRYLHRCSSVTCFNENIQYLPPVKTTVCCCLTTFSVFMLKRNNVHVLNCWLALNILHRDRQALYFYVIVIWSQLLVRPWKAFQQVNSSLVLCEPSLIMNLQRSWLGVVGCFGRKTQNVIGAPGFSDQWLSVLTVSLDHTHSADGYNLLPVHVGLVSKLIVELHHNQPGPSLKLWPRIIACWYFLNAHLFCTIVPLSYTSVYFSPTWTCTGLVPEHGW